MGMGGRGGLVVWLLGALVFVGCTKRPTDQMTIRVRVFYPGQIAKRNSTYSGYGGLAMRTPAT
jgi:hypothetical protein